MLKGVAVVCSVLSLCACVSFSPGETSVSPSEETNYWLTPPKTNELVVVGVSGRQTKREAEIQNACEDATKKVSMYYGIYAEVENSQYTGAGFFEVAVDTKVTIEYDQQIERYLDKLVFDPERDVYDRGNAVYVRFTYPESFPGDISYHHFDKNHNGSPKWTTSPPNVINGHMASIGFARRQERFQDSIIKSFESAAASFVSSMSTSVSADAVTTFTSSASSTHQHSRGRLTHFLVLETWVDPNTEYVYTLAVARNAN
jgi:hypothetical protein